MMTPTHDPVRPAAASAAKRPARKAAARPAASPKPAAKAGASGVTRLALSLHIGVNVLDPKAYAGWSGELVACEADARAMAALARSQKYRPTSLLTKAATRRRVLAGLRDAAAALKAGDRFLLSYAGHGGQVPDTNGEERDSQDETWCLYDGQLIDDELYFELSRFAAGVSIVVVSDSCHSGTVTRAGPSPRARAGARPRLMPPLVAQNVYRAHQAFYDGLQASTAQAARADGTRAVDPDVALARVAAGSGVAGIVKVFQPAAILISGCQDNQVSMDGERNGAFTEQLLAVWNDGAFEGSYARLHQQVKARMPATQTPNLFGLGSGAAALLREPAFRTA
jgi:hypothetical protein